ncbi:MAG: hypothetical protein ACQEWZ_12750, partial [Pseudomonadota bacterium]
FLAWFSEVEPSQIQWCGTATADRTFLEQPHRTAWHALICFMQAFDRRRIEKTVSMCHTLAHGNNPNIGPSPESLAGMTP